MSSQVTLPRLGQGMESGTIVRWLKSEGDQVEKGEPLYELDTEKVTQEVEADSSGVLLKILAGEGEEIEVGKAIAVIGEEGEDVPDAEPEAKEEKEPEVEDEAEVSEGEGQEEGEPARERDEDRERGRQAAAEQAKAEPQPAAETNGDGARVKASPLARRIARERGIDLRSLRGTGPEGRIVAEDVERAQAAPAPRGSRRPAGEVEVIPLTGMRKTIARRMTEAWQAPAFQITMTADMSAAIRLREGLVARMAEGDAKPTYSDILTKVCAVALMRHRAVNALFAGEEIHLQPTANVGIAVAIPNGLVVPVLRELRDEDDPAARRRARRRRRAHAREQAEAGGPRGRHVHDLEPRHVRRRALRRRPQPAAGRHPRGRRDRGAGGRPRRRARGPAGDGDDALVRPPHRRRRHGLRVPPHGQAVPRRARARALGGWAVSIWYRVRDLEAARAFYRERLGFEEAYVDEEDRWARLVRGNTELAIAEGEREEGDAVLTLDVTDLKQEAERLRGAGVEVGTVLEIPGTIRLLDVFDPDGNRVQLSEEI